MSNITYRADIDGLRAIAVLSVLFTHLGINSFSGGFVGVDIFFVISGYLITTIIVKQIKSNNFSILSFYDKRIRRIFPALFVVIVFTIFLSYVLLLPDDFKNFGQSIVATSIFSSNVLFWMESGYFSSASEFKPLLHTWSLGVEEQFYVFFPLLLLFLYKYFFKYLKAIIVVIAVFSFLLSIYGIFNAPAATFYLIPTRAWELMIGSILALNMIPKNNNSNINNFFALLGITMIILSIFTYDKSIVFPGYNALFPTIGAFLIIFSYHEKNIISKLLSIKPMVFIGLISYSLYLWHWPIIVFYKYYKGESLNYFETIVILLLSIIMAYLTSKYIENPFRNKNFISRKKVFLFYILLSTSIIFIGLFINYSKGMKVRIPENIKDKLILNEKAKTDWDYPYECDNYRKDINRIQDVNMCKIENSKDKKVFIWGDSHAEMYYTIFKNEKKKDYIFATSGGCLPVRGFNRIESGYYCDNFNETIFNHIIKSNYETVIISSRWDYIGNKLNHTKGKSKVAIKNLYKKLENDIIKIKNSGKKVVIVLPLPRYKNSPPIIMQKRLWFKNSEKFEIERDSEKIVKEIKNQLIDISVNTNSKIIDHEKILCKNDNCIYELNDVSIYKDSIHLTSQGAYLMKPYFMETLK